MGGTRSRRSRSSRRPRAAGASTPATPSSSTTTSRRCPPHAPGGCCATPGSRTCGCSTAGSRRGRTPGTPSRPAPSSAEPGDVTLAYGTLADARPPTRRPAVARDGVLLDARAAERFRGEVEPIDPRAGHIPGAVSAPTTDNLDADGRFLPPERARCSLRRAGCASGCAGRRLLRVRRHRGSRGARARGRRLRRRPCIPGSWSAWSNDPGRPVATGGS